MKRRPQFAHDCDACQFIGHVGEHDLYFCTQGGLSPTIVARYGDEGYEYTSGKSLSLDAGPVVVELALPRAPFAFVPK